MQKKLIYLISSILLIFTIVLVSMFFLKNTNTENKMDPKKITIQLESMELATKNLSEMEDFYKNYLGLKDVKQRDENTVYLGDNKTILIKLFKDDNLKPRIETEAGLYHTAIVYPTQQSLADKIYKLSTKYQDRFQGSADHFATEAFYFSDPDGNGVEIYYDKPRSEWTYDEKGNPLMGSARLDPKEFLVKHLNEKIDNNGYIKLGHFHLKGGNIPDAKKFYIESLMFDNIKETSNALFTSRDGYHHHIAINTWESAGAKKRTQGTIGMKSFTIRYYDKNLFNTVINNIKKNKYEINQIDERTFSVKDPWDNLIYLNM